MTNRIRPTVRLAVAAAIGAAIALCFYLLLRVWEWLTFRYHVPIWIPFLIEAAQFALFYGGVRVLTRRAK